MQNERKKLEELNLLDDFLFNAMMTYPEMGEKFTRKILKLLFNKEFRNLKVIAQKSYGGLNTDLRGARLDVYVESDDSAEIDASEDVSIYDLEPDKNDRAKYVAAFPQRIRFYHAIIDSRSLKSGEDFGKLKRVYVIDVYKRQVPDYNWLTGNNNLSVHNQICTREDCGESVYE